MTNPDAIADLMRAGLCRHCALEVVVQIGVLLDLPGNVDLCPECGKAIGNWIAGRHGHGR
jgi:hypothetical protein